ncbi:MAG: hypothetical protein KY054_00715 [Candidatus Nealsonbacteria bacterium]|nr:hypothetical protein [Candidatus Nealsonbacteria bacterium]
MLKKKKLFVIVGLSALIVFLALGFFILYSNDLEIFSSGEDIRFKPRSELNVEEILNNMDSMEKEEIEETIKNIEKEIDRLKSSL